MLSLKAEIKQLTEIDDIYKTILSFDKDIVPSLSERGLDLKEYAKKLFEFAIVYAHCCDNQECGYVAFYANDTDHKTAYLAQIAVKKQFCKHGIGHALLKVAMETSIEKGMKTMDLEVFKSNQTAIELYISQGFTLCSDTTGAFFYMHKEL